MGVRSSDFHLSWAREPLFVVLLMLLVSHFCEGGKTYSENLLKAPVLAPHHAFTSRILLFKCAACVCVCVCVVVCVSRRRFIMDP